MGADGQANKRVNVAGGVFSIGRVLDALATVIRVVAESGINAVAAWTIMSIKENGDMSAVHISHRSCEAALRGACERGRRQG
jgi:hypothetical protein